MGYEVTYFYKESTEIAGTYSEEILSKTSKIGKFDEEISLEVLAGKIMAQLARRNILIVDIEIYEYTKKKISYKESKDGIVIKNKKFSFDSGAVISSESETDEELNNILENQDLLNKLKSALGTSSCQKPLVNIATRNNIENDGRKALRYETYDPELLNSHKIEQKGYKFTVGKRYPIYSEKKGLGTINYITKDDRNKEVEISAECFVAVSMGLSFQEDESPNLSGNEVNLWKNVQVENSMPNLR